MRKRESAVTTAVYKYGNIFEMTARGFALVLFVALGLLGFAGEASASNAGIFEPTAFVNPFACVTDPVVTNNGDSGPGTLRQAVLDACVGSHITFAGSVASPILSSSGQIVLTQNVFIDGPGARVLTLQNTKASSANDARLFYVNQNVNASISGITITGGKLFANGAGIFSEGNLTLDRVEMRGNQAGQLAGLNYHGGGAISHFTGNLVIRNSTIADNLAGGIGGGIVLHTGTLAMYNTTVTGNESNFTGGGVRVHDTATATIVGCTITNNRTHYDFAVSDPPNGSGLSVKNTASASIANTVVAANFNNATDNDVAGAFSSQGFNFIGNVGTATGFGVQDQVGTWAAVKDPLLQALAYNGGQTRTQEPLLASQLLDKGKSFSLTTDQRGALRTYDIPATVPAPGGDNTDIGAFELQTPMTTTTIASSANPSVVGQTITLTATVTANASGSTPSGTVNFFDSVNAIAGCQGVVLNGSAQATCTTAFSLGSHSITAFYTGSQNSSFGSVQQLVTKADTVTTITSDAPDPSVIGQNYTVAVSVAVAAPGAGTPTGSIQVSDGTNSCQIQLPATTCVLPSTAEGQKNLTASYSGDTNFLSSTDGEDHTVNRIATQTTVVSAQPTTIYGQSVTFTATAVALARGTGTPDGAMSFYDGVNAIASCQNIPVNNAGSAQCAFASLNAGVHTVAATFLPGTNYAYSAGSAQQTVNKAVATARADNISRPYGAPNPPLTYHFENLVLGQTQQTSGITGSPVLTTTATVASPVAAPYPITITAGTLASANYSFAFIDGTLTVVKADTLPTISNDVPDPTVFGQNYTVTTAVAVVAPGSGTPTGNVTVSDGTNACVAILPATSCVLPSTSVGAKTLTATLSGDGNFNGSVSTTASHTVIKADSAVNVQVSMNAPTYGQTATLAASLTAVTPGSGVPQGTVNFSDGGFAIAGCQNVAVSAVGSAACSTNTLLAGVGKVIQAVYSGNANFNGSNGSATLTINKVALNVTASSHTVTYGDAAPAVTSTVTGFVLGETTSVLSTQPACSTTYTQGSSAAGSQYSSSCSGAAAANYSFNYVNGTVTVNKKALTVTADGKTRAYGAANPALTATFIGFVLGQNLGTSGVTGSPLLTTTAVPSSPVNGSPYAITAGVGTLQSANYSFPTFVNGTLTITAAQLTVTADNQTRVFGTANPALTFQIADFQNGETFATSGVTGTPAISTTATTASSPGTYPITVAAGSLSAPNYTFAFVNGTLTVMQATTTTTVTNASALGSSTAVGQSYAVNWTVTPNAPGAGTPTGTVTVSDGTGATCSAAVAAGTCSLTSTTLGVKTITASYAGDANFAGSTSQTVGHTVVIGITGNVKQFVAFGTNTNLAGVTITVSGSINGTTVTDANGNYSFGLTAAGGSYVLTPSGLGKTYEALSRTYNNVNGNVTGADFIAYDTPGPNAIPRTARISSQIATQGQPVTIPVLMATTGVETKVAFSIEYPVAALGVPTVTCGSGAVGCALTVNNSLAGKLGITITPTAALTAGTAEIAKVTFPTFSSSATSAAIKFGDFPTARDVRNAGNNPLPMLYWTDGLVSFTGGTLLEGATISGRVTTAAGQGLRNATVTIIDAVGNRRTTVSSSFGAYQFEGLELGRDYLLTVTSKRFRFSTQTVNLTGNMSDVSLVGLE
ncbi:MAG: Ig-like domain repeat protein [Pyrinomonadaceae bacterium]